MTRTYYNVFTATPIEKSGGEIVSRHVTGKSSRLRLAAFQKSGRFLLEKNNNDNDNNKMHQQVKYGIIAPQKKTRKKRRKARNVVF